MIEEKFYTEKEGRDPNVYLGIDKSYIPLEYFKGMFSEKGTVYTNDVYSGVQLMVADDEKHLLLVTMDPNQYITKEDAESTDIWFKICHSSGDGEIVWDSVGVEKLTLYDQLLNRYYAGETGLLDIEEIKYNDKGEYMRKYISFDTRPDPEAKDIRDTLRKHISFVYADDPLLPWQYRLMEVKTNHKNFELMFHLLVQPQLEFMKANNIMIEPAPENKIGYSFIMASPFGKVEIVKEDTIQDFIVTRKDK